MSTLLLVIAVAAYPLFISAATGKLLNAEIGDPMVTRYGAGIAYLSEDVPFDRASLDVTNTPLFQRRGQLFAKVTEESRYLGPTIASILGPVITVGSNSSSGTYAGRVFGS